MVEEKYKVVFTGQLNSGAEPQKVKQNLSALFKTDLAKIETLFTGNAFILKGNLNLEKALLYKQGFEKTGAQCQILKMTDSQPQAPDQPVSNSTTTPQDTVSPPTKNETSPNPQSTVTDSQGAQSEMEEEEDFSRFIITETKKKSRVPRILLALLSIAIVAAVIFFGIKRMDDEDSPTISEKDSVKINALSSQGKSLYYEPHDLYTIQIPNGYTLSDESTPLKSSITFNYPGGITLSISITSKEETWQPEEAMLKKIKEIQGGQATPFMNFNVETNRTINFNGMNGYEISMRNETGLAHYYEVVSITDKSFSITLITQGANMKQDYDLLKNAVKDSLRPI